MSVFDEFDSENKENRHSNNKVNPNDYNPYTGEIKNKSVAPQWLKYTIIVLMVLIFFVVGIIIGVFAIGRNTGDLSLLNQVKSIVDKEYYGDKIDWDAIDAETTDAMLRAINGFNGLSLMEVPSKYVFGITYYTDMYNTRYIGSVSPNSAMSEAVGIKAAVSSMGNGNVDVRRDDDGIAYKVQRGDKIYALGNTVGTTYKLVDGMDDAYLNVLLNNNALAFVFVREEVGRQPVYYRVQAVKSTSGAAFSQYYNLSEVGGEEYSNIGYMNFSTFSEKEAMKQLFAAAEAFRKDRANKLIFDLRGNGGGAVDYLLQMMPLFVKHSSNLPIMQLTNDKGSEILYAKYGGFEGYSDAYLGDNKTDFQLAVLVNGSSASASEAFVGALRYHNPAAKVIGTDTYGKGVSQSTYKITSGNTEYRLAVVTAKFNVPELVNGNMIWKNYHGKTMPMDFNFYADANADSITDEEYFNINRPYYDLTREVIVKKALSYLMQ